MKDTNYITIQGWMRSRLGLVGNELLTYAIIYGFCQDEESRFTGSLSYLSSALGISKTAITGILKRLVEKGLIKKIPKTVNNILLVDYVVSWDLIPIKDSCMGVYKKVGGGIQESCMGIQESYMGGIQESCMHNNILDNTKDNTKDINKKNINKKSGTTRPDIKPFGEFKNVWLTTEEVKKLIKKYGWYFPDALEKLSSYLEMKGDKYKNHYAVLCENNWVWNDVHNNPDCGMKSGRHIPDSSKPGGLRDETVEEYLERVKGIKL